jgi:hypothetical protein
LFERNGNNSDESEWANWQKISFLLPVMGVKFGRVVKGNWANVAPIDHLLTIEAPRKELNKFIDCAAGGLKPPIYKKILRPLKRFWLGRTGLGTCLDIYRELLMLPLVW